MSKLKEGSYIIDYFDGYLRVMILTSSGTEWMNMKDMCLDKSWIGIGDFYYTREIIDFAPARPPMVEKQMVILAKDWGFDTIMPVEPITQVHLMMNYFKFEPGTIIEPIWYETTRQNGF